MSIKIPIDKYKIIKELGNDWFGLGWDYLVSKIK